MEEKKIRVGDRVKVNMPKFSPDPFDYFSDTEWEEFTGEVIEERPFSFIVKRDYVENSYETCKEKYIEVLSQKQVFSPEPESEVTWFGEALLEALKKNGTT